MTDSANCGGGRTKPSRQARAGADCNCCSYDYANDRHIRADGNGRQYHSPECALSVRRISRQCKNACFVALAPKGETVAERRRVITLWRRGVSHRKVSLWRGG